MSELSILASEPSNSTPGFWKRQFDLNRTPKQIVFDVMFGVIGPVLCFIFDPIVFQSRFLGPALLADYQVLVYLFSGLQILTLGLWLLTGGAARFSNELIGATLFWGGVVSLLVGLMLFPFSVLGIYFYGIGLAGLTPFLTAMVYFRNGVRALRAEPKLNSVPLRGAIILLSLVLITGIPVALSATVHAYIDKSVSEILRGDSQHALNAAHDLWPLGYFASSELDRLVQAYIAEPDPARKDLIKSCYHEITGDDIELRARIILD